MQETWEMRVWSLDQEYPLEEEIATHSSIIAWRIPWIEEPDRRQSVESQSETQRSDFHFPRPPRFFLSGHLDSLLSTHCIG